MKPNPRLDERMWEQGYVSVQEAAERTCIASSTLYDKMDNQEILETRIGNRRYVEVESLLAWGGDGIRALWESSLEG